MTGTRTKALAIWILCGLLLAPAAGFLLAVVAPAAALLVYGLLTLVCAVGAACAIREEPAMRAVLSVVMLAGIVLLQIGVFFVGCSAWVSLK